MKRCKWSFTLLKSHEPIGIRHFSNVHEYTDKVMRIERLHPVFGKFGQNRLDFLIQNEFQIS